MRTTLPSGLRSRRLTTRLLAGTTLAVSGCLAVAVPARADVVSHTATPHTATAHAATSHAAAFHAIAPVEAQPATVLETQNLAVPTRVAAPRVVEETFTAPPLDVPELLQKAAPQLDAATNASTAAALGAVPGQRLTIVGAALGYLGTPYVLGGASRSGIDCSGLITQAYATIGMNLVHYVPTQDAAGHRIAATEAKPGDLVVFDDEEHVGMYLGNGMLVAAPAPGRDVQIEALSMWSGIGYHFTRLLDA
ncbi:MAG TPA: C40 family peptidase [Gryllotalpicola sp.]